MLAHGNLTSTLVTFFLVYSTVASMDTKEIPEHKVRMTDNWEKIAEHKINIQSESDEVPVFSGQSLQAFKVKSRKGGINLHKCTIVFKDGSRKTVDLRNDIPPGGESRTIPINSQDNGVVKMILWYDTKHYGQAVELEIWGRR